MFDVPTVWDPLSILQMNASCPSQHISYHKKERPSKENLTEAHPVNRRNKIQNNMMNKVVVNESCLVRPDNNVDGSKRTLLSALSHFAWYVQYRSRFLFFRPPQGPLSFDAIAENLKKSLGKALTHFYPVAGRLIVRDDGRMQLESNGEGILFIKASADVALGEVGDGDSELPPEFLLELTQTAGHTLKWPWPADAPLFFVQVTRFSCGGICISIKFNHQVLDGTSAWDLVKAWAETCCGKNMSLVPQLLDNPINIVPAMNTEDLKLPSFLKRYKRTDLLSATVENPSCMYVTKSFTFSSDMVGNLKQQNPGFSKFQLLSAHIWHKITVARNLDEEDLTTLHFAVNCRGKFWSLPEAYCGQGALIIGATMTVGALQAGMTSGASVLRKTIRDFTEEAADSFCGLLEKFAGDQEHAVFSKLSSGKDLIVASSFYFPVYEDFGFGKPIGMTIIPTPNDGRLYYFPGRDEGSVAAFISLPSEVMHKLQADPTFCK